MDHRIEIYRNKHTGYQHAWCTACNGEGKRYFADGSGDPERDYTEKCGVCDGDGFWRVDPLDSLEVLALKRRYARNADGFIRGEYELARLRAMRRASGLALADMNAWATRCATRAEELQRTLRVAA